MSAESDKFVYFTISRYAQSRCSRNTENLMCWQQGHLWWHWH